jgi:chorismate mutase
MNNSLKIKPLKSWLKDFQEPLLISGPCSAESEDQLRNTAKQLVFHTVIRILRAGIWKPRSRANMFEGVGEIGLKWLKKVKKETSLLTAVEVAKPHHVELCLKHGVDVLWIGARTSVNPFSIQELAEALKGVDIPVMIKNPVIPDIQLWLGVIERINQAGIKKIIAIHRGFNTYGKSAYRNEPLWEIPIELKSLLLLPVAQKALDLAMDGLIIESHINPSKALTDARQQITPEELGKLLAQLNYRAATCADKNYILNLEGLRSDIDRIDQELLNILSKRMDVVKKIGDFKKQHNITILQLERWKVIIHSRLELAKKLGLNTEFLMKLLQLVHKESIQLQTEIMNENKKTN